MDKQLILPIAANQQHELLKKSMLACYFEQFVYRSTINYNDDQVELQFWKRLSINLSFLYCHRVVNYLTHNNNPEIWKAPLLLIYTNAICLNTVS